jgi:hypothetical protein
METALQLSTKVLKTIKERYGVDSKRCRINSIRADGRASAHPRDMIGVSVAS